MEPIKVPAVPKTSFNKHRRVSDLLYSQLKHFQHVAQKQGIAVDPALPREIHTEGGAARYIMAVTRAVREHGLAMKKGTVAPALQLVSKVDRKKPATTKVEGLAIAAASESGTPRKKSVKRKNASKKA